MESLKNTIVVVAGGTGNVGSFIVSDLLRREAIVAVPSRSPKKIEALKAFLNKHNDHADLNRLNTFQGDIGNEKGARQLLEEITGRTGKPDAAISSLGRFIPAPSLLGASADQLKQVINDYLIAHFIVSQTFLRIFKERNSGVYVFINGPLALEPWEGSGAGLVSTATAGQQMLFKALAQELEGTGVTVTELMNYAYIRERKTQPGSSISGEATGAYASYLISGSAENIHGQTIQLQSAKQLEEAGLDVRV